MPLGFLLDSPESGNLSGMLTKATKYLRRGKFGSRLIRVTTTAATKKQNRKTKYEKHTDKQREPSKNAALSPPPHLKIAP